MTKRQGILTVVAFGMIAARWVSAATVGPTTTSTSIVATPTDWSGSLTFPKFDSSLGVLTSVTIEITGSLQTKLTVTNTDSAGGSHGTAKTELQVGIEDAGNNFGFTNPPNNTPTDNPAIDIFSPGFAYNLGIGQSSQSGNLMKPYDSGALPFNSAAILTEFTGPAGSPGTIVLNAGTLTQTNLSNTGGNTSATQVTTASLTGTVIYTYNPQPALTCPAVTSGEVGVAFNSPAMNVTSGTAPFTFSVATGALPAGLNLNAATGAITGTPTAAGTFTIQVRDANGLVAATTCPFTIVAVPTVTCSATNSGEVGVAFNSAAPTVMGGTAPFTFSVATGTLPAGLMLNAATGAITGTPTAAGTFTIQVKDANNVVAASTCPFTITTAPTVTCPAVSTGEVGAAFNSPAMTVGGGTAPYTFSVATGALPAGLTLNTSTGAITGTPTAAGTFTIQVKDANGFVAATTCPFTITTAPTVTCPAVSTGQVGAAFNSPAMTVGGGTGPYTFSVATGALPAGLTLNLATGAITGTPTAAGTFTIQVKDANGFVATTTCPFTITTAPTVTCPAVSTGEVGAAFNSPAMTVGGGTAPYTFSVATGALPAGLTLNAATGAITGTPTAAGTFTIQVKDANGFVAATTCPFTITAAPTVTCSATTTGATGVAFNSGAITVNGGTAPFTFSVVGVLLAGLSLNTATGAVTGTPTAAGTFGVKVTDANGVSSPMCSITINTSAPAPPSVACSTTNSGEVGAAFNGPAMNVTGGTAPYTFSVATGTLPAGLTLNTSTGAITGTPTAAGSFTIQVRDATGAVATATCPFAITAGPTVTCPAVSSGEVGAAFNSPAVNVTGGTAPYVFSVATGTLPAGLTLNTSTGAITGMPAAAGTFTIQVRDAKGAVAATVCPFTITGGPAVTCPAVSSGEVGVAFSSAAMNVTGGTAPYVFSVATGTLPAGLTLNASTGAITGTPTAAGTFTIQVRDAKGVVAITACPFTIGPGPTVTCAAVNSGEAGSLFNSPALTVTGGVAPYTFSVATGTLPAGLTLNTSTGAITGTPLSAGTFTIQVRDANGAVTTTTCPFTIAAGPTVTCPAVNSGQVGTAFNSAAMTVTGGAAPYVFSVASGTLPAGLTLNTSTGAVTGTPTAAGAFTIQVKDADGVVATTMCPFTFTGNSPDLLLTKTFVGTPVRGGPGVYQLTVMNDGTAPTTGVVTLSDPLPSSLTATGISGSGWACSLVSVSCTRSDALAPGASYPPVTLNVNIASNAPANIVNVATTVGGGSPVSTGGTAQNTVAVAGVLPTITLVKTASQTTAQLGDVVGYTIAINNTNAFPFTNDVVNDVLPAGFAYVPGSARLVAGAGAAQPIVPVGTTGTIVFNLPTLAALATDTITYRVQIGGSTRIGQNVNTAQFTGTNPAGGPVASQAGGAGVNVTPGFFTLQQFLIGRVFVDANGNGSYDKGEKPLAGVRVYLSTGASASTDSQGEYNIPVIAPGSVVVALDPATVPKGYTISSGGRLPDENWSRLVRTPLQGGIMLRQNFALKRCPNCAAIPEPPAAPPVAAQATSTKPAARIEVLPQQDSIAADGRSTMTVRVRVTDADGNLVPAKEIRVRASAGQFVPATDSSAPPGPSPAGVVPGESNVFGAHTKAQLGRTTEQVPDTLQAGVARMTQGEATFQLMAANQPGTAEIVAESGDPDHLLRMTTEITFLPEKRGPILATDGEVSVGRAAPDLISYGQDKEVVRHGEAFLRTPLGDDFLLTLAYTSHLTINDSNGNPGLFQLDPLNRVYPVFGDSSTQYQMAQSNSHVYGRLDHQLSYLLFGDIRMGANPAGSGPFSTAEGFVSQPGDAPQNLSGAGDYNRNVVGAAIHLEDKRHNSLTLEGARPNTAFARDIFPGSTFGLIQLSHVGIVPGTDNGVLEVRDRNNPEILISRESLVRSVDYSIDVTTGGIFFLRTLNAFDMNLDLVQLVFTYEYLTIGQTSSVYGARSELRLSSIGMKLGLGLTDQRDPTAGSYYLGNATIQEKLPSGGHLNVEVPVSHGSALAAGYSTSATDAPADVNGTAIRADLVQPFGFMQGRVTGSFSKTDQNFFNPFGTIVIPGALTTREAVEITPIKGTKFKFGFTEERNHTSLVDNHRQSGSLEVKQFLTEHLSLVAGYDYRDFQDTMNVLHVNSNEVNAGLDWRPTKKFTASVKREQNLTASDPTYPNETLLSARYQVSETVRMYFTQRLSSAPILPIADLSTTGLVTPNGKNETSIGVEDKWSRYTSINTGYLIEDGVNGTDGYAVIGLVNRIPLDEQVSLDLGVQRGQLVSGKDGSFNSGTIGFSWLPVKSLRMSTRYELRDQGGLGQIFTVGAAGRLSQGVTMLARYQLSSAAFNPGSGAIDVLSPLSTNPILSQQTNANQGTAALAWRNWRTDREGLLFSWTMRTSTLDGLNTTLPQNDRVNVLMTDAYYQPHRRIEFYGKFAFSDRQYNYVGDSPLSTQTYLYQGRTQVRISRRFDAALEGRFVMQPDTSIDQWTVGAEGGFWLLKDLRVGLGYNFKSADQIAANFLTNPVRQGVYFVLSTKLSNMFNLFDPHECDCAKQPAPVIPPAPKPVANIQISAITGARDVCPGENLRLQVAASGWLPDQTPAYQWYINDQAVAGATSATLMVPTADGSGTKAIRVTVTAGSITKTSNTVNVDVKRIALPTIQFSVMPSTIAYGEKAPLTATATASECAMPPVITYTASEGAIAGTTFDSSSMQFDMTNRTKLQSRVVQLTATATDRIGQTAVAPATITVTLQPEARRLDDIVFTKDSDRVNNCGKRLLLDELTPMLRADPEARVILIGHRDGDEKKTGLGEGRVLNAAAVLSAGTGICPQLDPVRILFNDAGTDQASETRPALCGASVRERTGQGVAESDKRAAFRRVEVWIVPGGAQAPANLGNLRPVPTTAVRAKGCPK